MKEISIILITALIFLGVSVLCYWGVSYLKNKRKVAGLKVGQRYKMLPEYVRGRIREYGIEYEILDIRNGYVFCRIEGSAMFGYERYKCTDFIKKEIELVENEK